MFSWMRRRLWRRPSTAGLLNMALGETPTREAPSGLQPEIERLRAEWSRLVELEALARPRESPDLDGLLTRILTATRASGAAPETVRERGRLAGWLATELEAYFGAHGRQMAPIPGGEAHHLWWDLAGEASLLSTFLGRRTATCITGAVLARLGPATG
jgi:hypothetical protein